MASVKQTAGKRGWVGTGKPGPGRKKGVPNKTTASVKEALSLAFQGLGGVPRLQVWATENPTEFYKLWSKMLPQEVVGEGGGPLTVRVTFEELPT
jgi:hypothetical protein